MKSIQAKLTASILAIFLVAMVTLGALNYWKARSMVVENVSENMNQLAVDAANDITSWLRISQAELLGLAVAPPIQGGNPQEASAFLANVMKNNKFFLALIYVTPDFHYYNSAGPTGVLSAQTIPYVKKALNGEATISEPVASKVDGQLASIVTVPIKVNGQVTGALMGSVRLTDFTQKILNVKVGKTGYAYVQSKDGLIIMHPDKDIAMQANGITDDKLSSAMKAIGQAMVNGEHGLSQCEIDGVEKMTSFTPIVGTDWSLALTVPTKEVTGPVSSLTMISLLTTLFILILAGFFIAWLARCIARPIQKLEVAANRIAAGDISQIKLDINSSDEIGQLGRSFEQMSGNLRGLIQKIHGAAEQVAASSQELTASSEQSAQVANQIAASIGNVASGASEQVAAANDTTVVVEQISAGIQQIAANTNQVAAHSVQAAEKAKYGDKAVEKAVAQMDQIKDTVNLSARVVSKLGERSKEIGQIVDTISGIAGQTNLLALNAAIEAARAGEQGRGFAVVAEEVRKLAEQSQEAAKKIAGLIGEIQEDTDKAVVAMDNGTQEVKTGAEVVNTAGSAFREIADLVTGVSGQVKEISAAMQQMASSSQNIVDSVKKIDILGKKSADEVHGVSAATEEQLASMEEIASSSQALANLAADLQEAVSEFQV